MNYTEKEGGQWRRGLKDRGIIQKAPPVDLDISTDDIMAAALYWLEHPEVQHRITGREIGFISSVHLQYRQGKKISTKQKRYVVALLEKHSK